MLDKTIQLAGLVFLLLGLGCQPTDKTGQTIPPAPATQAPTVAPPLDTMVSNMAATTVPDVKEAVAPPATSGLIDKKASPEPSVPKNQPDTPSAPVPDPVTVPQHEQWDRLLQKHVTASGSVNYAEIKQDLDKLQTYLEELKLQPPQPSWSKAEEMAYWINLYNAATVHLIAERYPVSSIMEVDGGKTWDVKRVKVGEALYSLNQIEHDILRKRFGDARIHFAVNCAAKGCPPLLNTAWTATNLASNLERQTRLFVNNSVYNRLEGEVKVSRIFEWYASDFGNLVGFLNRYSVKSIPEDTPIEYLEYDWALNRQ
ncbi:MAG: DUF547 domain-containing protein [Saprospiraceae bacterium]